MVSFEKKILRKIEDRLWLFVLIVAFLLGCYVRIMLRNKISNDMTLFLIPWYDSIKEAGGFAALKDQVGNYNIPYQFFIAVFSYLPISPVFAYKIFSIIFDLLLACAAGLNLYDGSGERNPLKGVCAFSLIWLSPIVVMNSSMWGQCDSIYTFFVILALFSLEKERFNKSFIFLGLAFAFKLQAIFILPFFIYRFISERKFSLLKFLYIPAVIWITSLPGVIAGRHPLIGFSIYFSQVDEWKALTMNTPNFINLIAYDHQTLYYDELAPVFICITAGIIGALIFYVLIKKYDLTGSSFYSFAILLTYTCIFFLPAMHERYGYVYEILAIIYCFKNKKSIIPCILMHLVSLCSYGDYLMQGTVQLKHLTFLNIAVYAMYVYLFISEKKEIKGGEQTC